jgi:glycosyltransferase involved in cell wall biosynthesis
MPKVSVVIATYNRAHLIGRAIQSVLDQNYRDFELIIVDDGSTDNTEEAIRRFEDTRIVYLRHEKNKGEAAARNTGINAAKGEYVAFQDSDDESIPERLEKQMNVFQRESPQLGIVYASMYRIDKEGRKTLFKSPTIMPKDGLVYRRALAYQVEKIGIGTTLVRRTCFGTAGLFDDKLRYYVDLEFFIRAAKHFYFYHIDEPLINYYEAGGSPASNLSALVSARETILEKYFDDIKNDRKLLATHYFGIGHLLCERGEIKQGRNYLMKAFLAYPLDAKFILPAAVSLFGQRSYSTVLAGYRKIRYKS